MMPDPLNYMVPALCLRSGGIVIPSEEGFAPIE